MSSAVALVGLRCSGKSTVGGALAELLGATFVDLDEVVAEADGGGASAGDLLERIGLDAFRDLEREALASVLATGGPTVVATGGGCVETLACRTMLARVRTFWLDAPPEVLAARLRADDTPRPSLTGADPAEEFVLLAKRRAPWYAEVSEHTLDATRSPAELASRIAERLASRPPSGR